MTNEVGRSLLLREMEILLREAAYYLVDDSDRPQFTLSQPERPIDQASCRMQTRIKIQRFLDKLDADRAREYLSNPHFRHVSRSRNFGGRYLNFYRKSHNSPTGCKLIGGVNDCDAVQAVLLEAGETVHAGGHMGNI